MIITFDTNILVDIVLRKLEILSICNVRNEGSNVGKVTNIEGKIPHY